MRFPDSLIPDSFPETGIALATPSTNPASTPAQRTRVSQFAYKGERGHSLQALCVQVVDRVEWASGRGEEDQGRPSTRGRGAPEPLYRQVERRIEDLLLRGATRRGQVPPEAELGGVFGRLAGNGAGRAGAAGGPGVLERRQGSVPGAPPEGSRLQSGLERLETYTIHAERLGSSSTAGLRSRLSERAAEEAALEIPEGAPLVKVSRVLLVEGKAAAWMVDVVPESVSASTGSERFRPTPWFSTFWSRKACPSASARCSSKRS